jgi:probable addiction module antidote protein
MPAYLFGGYMSGKSVTSATRLHSNQRQAAADCINQALEKLDSAEICHAIAAATHLYNISDLARKSGLARPSIHRAFAGDPTKPNFTTVLNVLDAMGFPVACHGAPGRSRTGGALETDCEFPRGGA